MRQAARCFVLSGAVVGLLAWGSPAFGQPAEAASPNPTTAHPGYTHRVWTTDDGLPQNSASALAQTRDGYLWIGTYQGLARFDGLRFTVFEAATTEGLNGDRVTALLEDREGTLWIGTETGGLSRYRDGQFTAYSTGDGLLSNHIGLIYEDRSGSLWVRTTKGFVRRQAAPAQPAFHADHGLPLSERAFYEDVAEDGVFWIAQEDVLLRGRPGAPLERIPLEGRGGLVSSLYQSRDGSLWVGTYQGILRHRDDRFTLYPIPTGFVNQILEDRHGTLWAVVDKQGLFRLVGSAFERFVLPGDPIGSAVLQMLEDREGSFWVGTNVNGLHRLKERLFSGVTVEDGLPGPQMLGVYEDRSGALWASVSGQGVVRLKEGRLTRYTIREGLPYNTVWSFGEDAEGRLWAATQGGSGAARFDGQRFVPLPAGSTPPDGPVNTRVLTPGRSGDLWVGSYRNVWRYRDGQLTRVLGEQVLPSEYVLSLYEAPSGVLWVGTQGSGLCRYENRQGSCYTTDDGLSNSTIRAIHPAAEDTLWLGTYGGGICRLAAETFTCLTKQDGLPDGTVHHILEDGLGFVWLSSNKGIFRLRRRDLEQFFDGAIERVYPDFYTEADGMPSSECNGGFQPAGWQARDGRLWFPTTKGLAVVDPARVASATASPVPPVYVEQVNVDGAARSMQEPLVLEPGSDRLVFQYTAPYLNAAEKLRFRYRLEGHDDRWIETGAARTATYTNLPPGTYVFEAQAAVGNGPWTNTEHPLAFALRPYVYQTVWFYLLCGLGSLALAVSLYGLRVRGLKQRQRHLEALVAERTRQLTDLDRAKSRFFANVSHEFRTPLMLITGPLEQGLADTEDADERQRQHGLMLKNARRLLRLVNQLLDLAKVESGRMTLQAEPGDLAAFLRDLVRAFIPMAERKHIALQLRTPTEHLPFSFDRDKLEKAVGNLLSNALKFTPEGGKVWVTLHEKKGRKGERERGGEGGALSAIDSVEIVVKDTGPGIPAEALPKIFERFVQVDDSATRAHEGTGIGLALARELVELHGGTILVESEPGFGSAFTIRLPVDDRRVGVEGDGGMGESVDERSLLIDGEIAASFSTDPVQDRASSLLKHPPPTLAYSHPPIPTILIVEDNAEVRALVRGYLGPAYRVLEAENGRAGLETAREAAPDLILSDVMMPELDGFALVRALKADEQLRAIPVVLLTARASEQDTVEGLESGADDYLAKPFSATELRARVARLIETRRQLQAQFSREIRVEPAGMVVPAQEEAFLNRATACVEANLGASHFGAESLAEELGMSPRQLRRKLRAVAGQSPRTFIQHFRLQRAAHLLEARAGTVAEIAYQVGFTDPSNFARAFRAHFGHAPSEHGQNRT